MGRPILRCTTAAKVSLLTAKIKKSSIQSSLTIANAEGIIKLKLFETFDPFIFTTQIGNDSDSVFHFPCPSIRITPRSISWDFSEELAGPMRLQRTTPPFILFFCSRFNLHLAHFLEFVIQQTSLPVLTVTFLLLMPAVFNLVF